MPLSLSKGSNMSLTKEAPGLSAVTVGLGWDARTTDGQPFDLDASAIVVGADGRVLSDGHFVFFNQLASSDGSVRHQGDNRTGQGDGDDEKIDVDLSALPAAAGPATRNGATRTGARSASTRARTRPGATVGGGVTVTALPFGRR